MEKFRKEDVETLYNAFIKLCDYIECEIECGKCPLWKPIDRGIISCQCDGFGKSLKRIREAIKSDKQK